ncbi:TRAUB-domain-containing protein [Sporormia fimetaria CBS 119925]|uniref:Protein BFR2 n=1 Tax=Sporormia fimetaria CBS 119925 TaxID=1340428 RepID=A0A6A6UXX7_9PLEO|nr:TRAUB-domain-containing protein [Sporormia fimetaria CBS 119925]
MGSDEESEDDDDAEEVDGVQENGVSGSEGSEQEEEISGDEEEFDINDMDSDEEIGSGDSEEDDNDQSGDEEEDSESEDEEDADQTAKLREMMKDTSLVASTLSKAAQADIEKGKAIKTQRKTFDTLLNSRVRLQKALISTNSLSAEPHKTATAPPSAIRAAETAALTLLNNLTNLRSSLHEARTGQKRKRTSFSTENPSSEIWSQISTTDSSSRSHRNTVLEKWSAKTRNVAVHSTKGRLNATASQTITDVLTTQLQDPARFIARTQVPRSCAPLQSASNLASSEDIYDDADFYGLLLKELLENRSSELNAGTAEFVVQAPWQLAREAKTKKIVDTRASKGRKLRYTVHEKLQNFMAPEDRGSWGERQRDELFGGLFGRRVGLGEEVEGSESEGDAGEEGLMLFRN